MTKKEFRNKYDGHIRTISREKTVDMGVAADILIAHARNRNKAPNELYDVAYYYNFAGCEQLNYAELDADIKALELAGEIPTIKE